MTEPLRNLWHAIESVPDLAAVPAEWRSLLGSEYEPVRWLLLPTQRLAGSVKSPVPGRSCVHEIRRFKGEYLSVCPDGCDTVTVPRDEIVVHKLDMPALCRQIAEALGLEAAAPEALPHLPKAVNIGAYVPYSGQRFAACLAAVGEPQDMRRAVDVLSAEGRPFILLALTRGAFDQACAEGVKRTQSCFVALAETLGLDGRGRLAMLDGRTPAGVFAEFLAVHVPQPRADDGMVFFPTPADARWEDVSIRFMAGDRHAVFVSVREVSGVFHYAQMGMANRKSAKPTKQWLLLEAFAEGHGRIDWRNREADRKNQKRKENLAADLKRFFRIEGDPFANEGDGWQARFAVAVPD